MAKQPTNNITKQQMEIIPSTLTEEYIRHRIYAIRGVQVMIDRDLAEMYGVETGQLNRQVKRNADRFPEDFMFQLTKEDVESLKCQFGISNGRGGVRYLPYAFIEELVKRSTRRIVLIDDYVDGTVLERLRARNPHVSVDVYVQNTHKTKCVETAFSTYHKQYPTEQVELHVFNKSHDRWLIIDDEVFHFGASIKDLGKKWFEVSQITEYTANELIAKL